MPSKNRFCGIFDFSIHVHTRESKTELFVFLLFNLYIRGHLYLAPEILCTSVLIYIDNKATQNDVIVGLSCSNSQKGTYHILKVHYQNSAFKNQTLVIIIYMNNFISKLIGELSTMNLPKK